MPSASSPPTVRRLRIAVRGVVQGVGFRPFVYNAARSRSLGGWVRNEALAVLASAEAQKSIVTLAGDKFAKLPVRISALKALAESVRRHGNQLEAPQAEVILTIVNGKDPQDLRQAAAQALGAMDLPSDQIKSLILVTAGHD